MPRLSRVHCLTAWGLAEQGKSKDVILKWQAPLEDNGSAVTAYKIYCLPLLERPRTGASADMKSDEGGEGGERAEGEVGADGGPDVADKAAWVCVQQVTAHLAAAVGPQATISQLVPGSQYMLRVTAMSEVGESVPSDAVLVSTSPAPPPAPTPPTISDADATPAPVSNCNSHGAGKIGVAVRVRWEPVRPHQLQGEVQYVLEVTDGTVFPPPQDAEWRSVFSGMDANGLVQSWPSLTRFAHLGSAPAYARVPPPCEQERKSRH